MTPVTRPGRPLSSLEFLEQLAAHEIIDEADSVRRVVIDAKAGSVVQIYVERYGDERLLDVITPTAGFEVRT